MFAASMKDSLLRKLDAIDYGRVEVEMPDGQQYVFQGKKPGPSADLSLYDWRVINNLALRGDIGFAEDYREGLWGSNNLENLLSFVLANDKAIDALIFGSLPSRVLSRLSLMLRRNTLSGSRRNIQAHYDLGNDFYQLWLDPTMTYSSALFAKENISLEEAQLAKYDRLIEKIDMQKGDILEVGCGWGGFAGRALERGDYRIKGITLSKKQKRYAEERLGGMAEFCLEDYRNQSGLYDRIVSIEMFEAVGEDYWKTYFAKMASLLKQGGKLLVQTITIDDKYFKRYRESGDFIRKHIFPGGMLPSPSKFIQAAESQGFQVADRFDFGMDYALTLECWLKNFDSVHDKVKQLGYDDSFIRMWHFYLAACTAGFRTKRTGVMQVELRRV